MENTMRNLIMWNLVTLDGNFEGARPWDLGWHEDVWGEEMEAMVGRQTSETGALLFGRKTYEGMASYWTTAAAHEREGGEIADFMNGIQKIVFSTTLEKAIWNNTRLVKNDLIGEVSRLKEQSGKDLYIFGSADLSAQLTGKNLIDEYRICLTPHILGSGNRLFKPSSASVRLKLLEARPLKTGAVILRYGQG
jgi:dihydrofolate reductase